MCLYRHSDTIVAANHRICVPQMIHIGPRLLLHKHYTTSAHSVYMYMYVQSLCSVCILACLWCVHRLLRAKGVNGTYLIRAGSHAGSEKVLSVWHEDRCRHYKLFKDEVRNLRLRDSS